MPLLILQSDIRKDFLDIRLKYIEYKTDSLKRFHTEVKQTHNKLTELLDKFERAENNNLHKTSLRYLELSNKLDRQLDKFSKGVERTNINTINEVDVCLSEISSQLDELLKTCNL